MPNWCYTTYTVVGEKKEIEALFGVMEKLEQMKEPLVPNAFGPNWLGCLVNSLGGDWEKVRCRGAWMNLNKIGDTMCFDTESAWTEPYEVVDFLKEKFPSLEFYYSAEEPGMRYYVTNDSTGAHFLERYYFATHLHDDERYYSKDEAEEFVKDVGDYIGKDLRGMTPDEIYEAVEEYNSNKEWEGYIEVKIFRLVC